MITTFESGLPAGESPAEKTPEQKEKEKKGLVSDFIMEVKGKIPDKDWNDLGTMLINGLKFINENEIEIYHQGGVEGFTKLAHLADVRRLTAELKESTEQLRTEGIALKDKNGGDFELPPNPDEAENLPENKPGNNSSGRIDTVGKNSTK